MSELAPKEIADMARRVARDDLPTLNIEDIHVLETVNSTTGDPALQVVLILTPETLSNISGNAANNAVFHMNEQLRAAGDDRFLIFRYTTSAKQGGDI
jgi:hypothetical protein